MRRLLPMALWLVLLAGCVKTQPDALRVVYARPVAASPPKGFARIVAVPPRWNGTTYVCYWKIRGDRSWTSSSGDNLTHILNGSQRLWNDGGPKMGPQDAYDYHLILERGTGNEANQVICKSDFRSVPAELKGPGAGGSGDHGGGTTAPCGWIPSGKKIDQLARPLVKGELLVKLPADVPLLELTIARQDGKRQKVVYRVKMEQ